MKRQVAWVPRAIWKYDIDRHHAIYGREEKPGLWRYWPQFIQGDHWHNYAGEDGQGISYTTETAAHLHLYRSLNQGLAGTGRSIYAAK